MASGKTKKIITKAHRINGISTIPQPLFKHWINSGRVSQNGIFQASQSERRQLSQPGTVPKWQWILRKDRLFFSSYLATPFCIMTLPECKWLNEGNPLSCRNNNACVRKENGGRPTNATHIQETKLWILPLRSAFLSFEFALPEDQYSDDRTSLASRPDNYSVTNNRLLYWLEIEPPTE